MTSPAKTTRKSIVGTLVLALQRSDLAQAAYGETALAMLRSDRTGRHCFERPRRIWHMTPSLLSSVVVARRPLAYQAGETCTKSVHVA